MGYSGTDLMYSLYTMPLNTDNVSYSGQKRPDKCVHIKRGLLYVCFLNYLENKSVGSERQTDGPQNNPFPSYVCISHDKPHLLLKIHVCNYCSTFSTHEYSTFFICVWWGKKESFFSLIRFFPPLTSFLSRNETSFGTWQPKRDSHREDVMDKEINSIHPYSTYVVNMQTDSMTLLLLLLG